MANKRSNNENNENNENDTNGLELLVTGIFLLISCLVLVVKYKLWNGINIFEAIRLYIIEDSVMKLILSLVVFFVAKQLKKNPIWEKGSRIKKSLVVISLVISSWTVLWFVISPSKRDMTLSQDSGLIWKVNWLVSDLMKDEVVRNKIKRLKLMEQDYSVIGCSQDSQSGIIAAILYAISVDYSAGNESFFLREETNNGKKYRYGILALEKNACKELDLNVERSQFACAIDKIIEASEKGPAQLLFKKDNYWEKMTDVSNGKVGEYLTNMKKYLLTTSGCGLCTRANSRIVIKDSIVGFVENGKINENKIGSALDIQCGGYSENSYISNLR